MKFMSEYLQKNIYNYIDNCLVYKKTGNSLIIYSYMFN
jgi:hypothetical protein